MTTKATVTAAGAAVQVTSIMGGNRTPTKVVKQTEASFVLHNTLSLEVAAKNGATVKVEASKWPVEGVYGDDTTTIEPGASHTFTFSSNTGKLELREAAVVPQIEEN